MYSKIYIAGKITGENYDKAVKKFQTAESHLNRFYKVINPTKIIDPDTAWHDAMRTCIKQLLECDMVYALKDWRESEGARLEIEIAKKLGMNVIYQKTKKWNIQL